MGKQDKSSDGVTPKKRKKSRDADNSSGLNSEPASKMKKVTDDHAEDTPETKSNITEVEFKFLLRDPKTTKEGRSMGHCI